MIYVPGKFLFIHIPRTAGTSLTFTLMRHLKQNVRVDTTGLWKHATAANLKLVIPDFHDIPKFAVNRDIDQIVESDYRLHQYYQHAGGVPDPALCKSVELSRSETLQQFRERRWSPWVGHRTAWEHWVGDEAVMRFEFDTLPTHWPNIMEICGLPKSTQIERLSR